MTDLLFLLKWAGIWLMITVVAEWVTAAFYPLFHRGIAPLNPALRSAARLLFGMTAPLSSVAVVVLLNQPSLVAPFLAEHCHRGLCSVHSPVHTNAAALMTVAMLSGLTALLVFALLSWSLHLSQRRFRLLEKLTGDKADGAPHILDTPGMMASCVGLWRPRVYLSRQLTQQLTSQEIQAVVAHEQAHAYRLDNLRNLILRWSSLLWPPGVATRIRKDYQSDVELACDQLAAHYSDPFALRSALEKMPGNETHSDIERRMPSKESDNDSGLETLQKIVLSLVLFLCVVCLVWLLLNAAHAGIEWLGGGT